MSMFDQDSTTYTQEGRIIQLEYANKAIETAEYPAVKVEPLSDWSARMELSSVLRNSYSPSCWWKAPTEDSTISISILEWPSLGKYLMADIWWTMLAPKP